VVVFRQSHILDAVAIERMAAGLKELVENSEEAKFVFGFEPVKYLSSSALGMLIGLHKRCLQRQGEMKLAGINDEVMEVFHITKLDTVFDIYKDLPAALEAFRKNF
jgi:anti-sigma B factor antagonist